MKHVSDLGNQHNNQIFNNLFDWGVSKPDL